MTGQLKRTDPSALLKRLNDLLANFDRELQSDDLRKKVLALVPANAVLRSLGSSLIEKQFAVSARDRILYYLRRYPHTIISGHELMVVGGIGEWARRVRELRVQFGWSILSGLTAKEMAHEEEVSPADVDLSGMKPSEYILIDAEQDRDAAFRWNTANEIRRKKSSVRDKILEYLTRNAGKKVTGEELRYVANNHTEWARRVRELRTELGWQVMTKMAGMPELPVGVYVLASTRQAPEHDRVIPDQIRRQVLQRDGYKCRSCGWSHDQWNTSDPRHLEAHHRDPHVQGGENTPENLTTLCNICHDEVHRRQPG